MFVYLLRLDFFRLALIVLVLTLDQAGLELNHLSLSPEFWY